ncbi:MAG: TIGR04211 family SH3 domain-containing protein [Thiohalospira sp.]|uniref:TIGR04211 family SH3 domain-containing protein n=1 Tax=Thiohalospira sp. TaxID=3080549 RepID=UPI00397EC037
MKRLLMAVLGLLACGVAAAETVYVSDTLRLGVRAEPDSSEPAESVVVSGMKLEVLERGEDHLRIRTEGGDEGWVKADYVTTEVPAQLKAERLQEERDQLDAEVEDLTGRLEDARNQQAALAQELEKMNQRHEALEAEIRRLRDARTDPGGSTPWWVWLAAALGLVVLGFSVGVTWYRHHVVRRLHGLMP